MSTRYLWRVTVVDSPVSFRRNYQTRQAAEDRVLRLTAQGLTTSVERSDPITWPDTEGSQ